MLSNIYILKFPTFCKNLCIPYSSQLRRHKFLWIICFKMFPWLAIPISYPTSSTFSLLHNIVRNLKRNYLDDFQVHLLDELQYKNIVIGVTEINITDPNCFGFHVEKFGTLVGGPIFHGWSTCMSVNNFSSAISYWFTVAKVSWKFCSTASASVMSRTTAARKLRSIHCKNFYKELDNFSTASINKMKRRKIYLFSGKYFEVERLIVERKSKDEVSRTACHSFSLPLKKQAFISFGKEKE